MTRLARRQLLLGATGLLLGCDSSRPREGLLGVGERHNERVQRLLFRPERLAPELGPEHTTPPSAFPNYFVAPAVPQVPPGWRLRIGGLVTRPLELSLAELQRLPRTDYRIRHHCVEGWTAVASWHGVQVRELARMVGVDPRAKFLDVRSFDRDAQGVAYYSSWDWPSAMHPQTILAWGINGEPLPPGHGAPVRLYGAVKLGYKMVKYVTEVNFLPERTGGYWEDKGYEWFAGV